MKSRGDTTDLFCPVYLVICFVCTDLELNVDCSIREGINSAFLALEEVLSW